MRGLGIGSALACGLFVCAAYAADGDSGKASVKESPASPKAGTAAQSSEEDVAKKFQAHMEKMRGLYEKIQLSKNTDERRFLKHEYMLEMQEGTKLFGLRAETAGHPRREIKKQSAGADSSGAPVMTDGERLRSLERRMGMTEQMMERMMERQSMEEK